MIRIVGVDGDRAVVVAPRLDSGKAVIAEEFFSIRIMEPGQVEAHATKLGATAEPGRNLRLVERAEASMGAEAEGKGTSPPV